MSSRARFSLMALARLLVPAALLVALLMPATASLGTLQPVAQRGAARTAPFVAKGTAALPARAVGGYLTTWDARLGLSLRSLVDTTSYNVIYVAFALGISRTSGSLQLDLPPGASSPADVRQQIAYANSKGRVVLVSVGGYYDLPGQTSGYRLDSSAKVDAFMASIRALRSQWGFNGMDWDLEHGDRPDKAGIVDASRRMKSEFGASWLICMAPGVNLASWVGAGGILDTLGPKGWDGVGEQIYDQGLSEASYRTLIVQRVSAMAKKYGAAKVLLGSAYKVESGSSLADPGNDFVDIATVKGALSDLRSAGVVPRGAFLWSVQGDQDGAGAWQSPSGVGGYVLTNP